MTHLGPSLEHHDTEPVSGQAASCGEASGASTNHRYVDNLAWLEGSVLWEGGRFYAFLNTCDSAVDWMILLSSSST